MATRSIVVTLNDTAAEPSAGWAKLSTLIKNEQPNLPTICNSLEIISPETNADGSRLEITSDPVNLEPAYRLLKEEHQSFNASCYNNMSTMDKWVRLVDEAGNPIDGTG